MASARDAPNRRHIYDASTLSAITTASLPQLDERKQSKYDLRQALIQVNSLSQCDE
jgi:hypothetical protein